MPVAPTSRISQIRTRLASGDRAVLDATALLIAIIIPTLVLQFDSDAAMTTEVTHGLRLRDLVAAAIFVPLVLLRHRFPVHTVAVGAVAAAAITGTTGARTVALPALAVLLFGMSSRRPRSTMLLAGGGAVVVVFTVAAARLGGGSFSSESFAYLAWFGLALAAGDAIRSRRQYVDSVRERARQLEVSREVETRRRVVEERLRIARELHDVVAHHMAIVNVQAGVASHLMRVDPDGAVSALGIVREAGRSVLDELSDLLNVLRSTDNESSESEPPVHPERPAPTMREIEPLVASFRNVGLRVDQHTSGDRSALTDTVGVTAYRIVEEALTNAHKYGSGSARLYVDFSQSSIALTITNDIDRSKVQASQQMSTGGHGLVGMRERVLAVNGTVDVGSSADDTFTVAARLPLQRIERP
jgi:signal transduction histidine kinase